MINIVPAERICGMMPFDCLEKLAVKASTCKNVAEIGCWRGRTTRVLCDNCPGTVYAIDTWEGSPELMNELNFMRTVTGDREWLFNEFLMNMNDAKNLKILRSLSLDAAKSFPDKFFDMVFLDAAHDYQSVRADIFAWYPKVVSGGLLLGDDYECPHVRRAVDELFILENPVQETRIWGAYAA